MTLDAASLAHTNYSVLCRVPSEDSKLYYWQNFQKMLPLFAPLMARFATTKVISWQHFERLRWDPKEKTLRSSGKTAPTGGSNNSWTAADLEKIFTLYLLDKTYHRYIWDNATGPLPHPPLDKRGYVFHYSTTVLGNVARLKPRRDTDWYNRETDFRFQIPYWFKQFPQANMKLEFSFKDGWIADGEREALVRDTAALCHGVEIHRCRCFGPGAFVHTLEPPGCPAAEAGPDWQRIA